MIVAINDSIYELALKQLFVMTDWQAVAWHCARITEDVDRLPVRTLRYLDDKLEHRPTNPDWSIDSTIGELHDTVVAKLKELDKVL